VIDALIVDSVINRPHGVVVSCGPVLFDIEASGRDSDALEDKELPCPVYCRVELSDDKASLVGFSDPDRRELYLTLRTVKGIGRRSALMILDCGEVRDTLRAVAGDDHDYFSGIPGLGAKRIDAVLTKLGKGYHHSLPNPLPLPVSCWVEARDSLLSEGKENAEEILINAVSGLSEVPQTASELLALASA